MASDEQNDEGLENGNLPDFGDDFKSETFHQILNMDDGEDDRSFSQSITEDFFEQAKGSVEKFDKFLEEKDLVMLSKEGHYLKGSSATLGMHKVSATCEKIQRYGKKENLDGSPEPDEELCLKRIEEVLPVVKKQCEAVKEQLEKFYNITYDVTFV